ncbi:hypothetical protein ABH19_04320 [Leptospirillum sp. Group II 'CF-1']|nr:hypothetical protein ABH19_04320 [Leptospirillum sp. Group II 'CF-1']
MFFPLLSAGEGEAGSCDFGHFPKDRRRVSVHVRDGKRVLWQLSSVLKRLSRRFVPEPSDNRNLPVFWTDRFRLSGRPLRIRIPFCLEPRGIDADSRGNGVAGTAEGGTGCRDRENRIGDVPTGTGFQQNRRPFSSGDKQVFRDASSVPAP